MAMCTVCMIHFHGTFLMDDGINSYNHPMSPYDIQHPSPHLNRRHRRSGSAMPLAIIDRLHELALLDERHVRRLRDAVDVGHLEVGNVVEVGRSTSRSPSRTWRSLSPRTSRASSHLRIDATAYGTSQRQRRMTRTNARGIADRRHRWGRWGASLRTDGRRAAPPFRARATHLSARRPSEGQGTHCAACGAAECTTAHVDTYHHMETRRFPFILRIGWLGKQGFAPPLERACANYLSMRNFRSSMIKF